MKTDVEKCADLLDVLLDSTQSNDQVDIRLEDGSIYLKDKTTNDEVMVIASTLIAAVEELGLSYLVSEDLPAERVSATLLLRNVVIEPEKHYFSKVEMAFDTKAEISLTVLLLGDWFLILHYEELVPSSAVIKLFDMMVIDYIIRLPEFQPAIAYVSDLNTTPEPSPNLLWENEHACATLNVDGLLIFMPKDGTEPFILGIAASTINPVSIPSSSAQSALTLN